MLLLLFANDPSRKAGAGFAFSTDTDSYRYEDATPNNPLRFIVGYAGAYTYGKLYLRVLLVYR
ncbi:MAG: hypothetical protein PHV20_10740 [Bacteroidales bacterium]|nr:hypothetical protein [Bacteroidales bacterium]